MKKEILLFLFLFNGLFLVKTEAQQAQSATQEEIIKVVEDFDGTFQIMYKTRNEEVFPINFREIVEQNRHQTDLVMLEYSEFTTVRIFPKEVVNDPNFVPITEIFIYMVEGK